LKSADPAAITAACTALGVDATTFSAYLPSPDAQVTAHLTEAVRDATDGSASCVSGDYTTATSKILAMNSQITASSTRLSQLK
jgi:hypothetical protein